MHFLGTTKKFFITSLVFLNFSCAAFAAVGHIYVGGNLETSNAKINRNTPSITYYNNLLTDRYPISGHYNTQEVIAVNGGYEFVGKGYKPAIALGLGLYFNPASYSYNGQVNESAGGAPAFLLYNYNYNVQSTRAMLETQFTWIMHQFAPFFNVGVGAAWNEFSSYSEKPATPTNYVVYPPFQSNTNVNFAYQAGFGISYLFDLNNTHSVFQNDRISLGYRYANLGNVSSGTRNSAYPFKLNLGTLMTNSIYLSYTHFF